MAIRAVGGQVRPRSIVFPARPFRRRSCSPVVWLNQAPWGGLVNRSEGDVLSALGMTADVRHQDQIAVFARALDLGVDIALRALVDVWLRNDGIRRQAQDLLAALSVA